MNKKRRKSLGGMGPISLLLVVLAGMTVLGSEGFAEKHEGLAALMERNRDHFENLVRTAYLESAEKKLEKGDFQRLRQEAEAIAGLARTAREDFSRGEQFDDLAGDLEKHAKAAAKAAAEQNLPEVNIHIGEMAEYCAECHNEFRWKTKSN